MHPTTAYRVHSIDILRGIVMIIMALDHTRDFFHWPAFLADPLDPAHPAIYFTRWITHFCAPAFVFLSGVSAWIAAQKRTKAEASLFLIKRGLWLVIVEITLVTFGIFFNPSFNFVLLQVIWAIGCSMILLGLVSRISPRLVLATGIILFFGHNILDHINPRLTGNAWNIFFRASGTVIPLDNSHFIGAFYAILPWTGVMFIGYSIGHWFARDFSPQKRQRLLLAGGVSLTAFFILLRFINVYGNPTPWVHGDNFQHNLLNFLNTSKYPPSLQYLCMTLGPACIALSLLERVRGSWTKFVSVYGQVPFFYYILHFYLLHLLLVAIFYATGHTNADIVTPGLPFYFRPPVFGYGLPVVYLIWIGVVLLLYYPCRWFSRYKQTHRQWWLSYV